MDGTDRAIGKGSSIKSGSGLGILVVPETNCVLCHCVSFRSEAALNDYHSFSDRIANRASPLENSPSCAAMLSARDRQSFTQQVRWICDLEPVAVPRNLTIIARGRLQAVSDGQNGGACHDKHGARGSHCPAYKDMGLHWSLAYRAECDC